MMRQLSIYVIALYFLCTLISASVLETDIPQVETSIPGLFVNTLTHDMGDIFWGETASFTFLIVNSSDKPIDLQQIRSDCGCKAELDDDAPLNPGDIRRLTVIYEPEYTDGDFSKKVSVYTDSSTDQVEPYWIEFTLSGRIVSILSIDPWYVLFKKVTEGQESVETIRVRADKNVAVSIKEVLTDSDDLQAILKPVSQAGDSSVTEWDITVTLLDSAPVGTFSGYVEILTDHHIQKTIRIRVLAYVRSAVSIYPTQGYLGTVDPGQVITKTFTIEKAGEEPNLKPPVVQSSFDWMQYSVETVSENRKYNVVVTITIPEDRVGRFSDNLVIETHEASTPTFNVPIFGFIFIPVSDQTGQESMTNTATEPEDTGDSAPDSAE